jgi:hypothetical protein
MRRRLAREKTLRLGDEPRPFIIRRMGVHMEYMVRLHFSASNNATEYEALVNGLRITVELGIKHLKIRGESELVVGEVMKDKNCVDPKMEAYCKPYEIWRASSTASSCTTCCMTTTRRLTCLQKRRPLEARCPMGSL